MNSTRIAGKGLGDTWLHGIRRRWRQYPVVRTCRRATILHGHCAQSYSSLGSELRTLGTVGRWWAWRIAAHWLL